MHYIKNNLFNLLNIRYRVSVDILINVKISNYISSREALDAIIAIIAIL